jgi:hypothetical protein
MGMVGSEKKERSDVPPTGHRPMRSHSSARHWDHLDPAIDHV